jgi:hypothetical protein
VLRLLTGSHLRDRPPPRDEPQPGGRPAKPAKMSKLAERMWDEFIAPAFWLTWADSRKARMWCYLEAEAERSVHRMNSSRIAQLRALGSELGFDPASRARLGAGGGGGGDAAKQDPASKYLT